MCIIFIYFYTSVDESKRHYVFTTCERPDGFDAKDPEYPYVAK